jgi:hypothetical protein
MLFFFAGKLSTALQRRNAFSSHLKLYFDISFSKSERQR